MNIYLIKLFKSLDMQITGTQYKVEQNDHAKIKFHLNYVQMVSAVLLWFSLSSIGCQRGIMHHFAWKDTIVN